MLYSYAISQCSLLTSFTSGERFRETRKGLLIILRGPNLIFATIP